jgi:hypothetical protein
MDPRREAFIVEVPGVFIRPFIAVRASEVHFFSASSFPARRPPLPRYRRRA